MNADQLLSEDEFSPNQSYYNAASMGDDAMDNAADDSTTDDSNDATDNNGSDSEDNEGEGSDG